MSKKHKGWLAGGKLAPVLAAIGLFLAGALPSISCCSLAPAHFAQTKGYAGVGHKDGKLVHILAYQNTAENLNTAGGGNAMFLPIPARPGTMTAENIIDTKTFPHFMDDMKVAITPPPLEFGQNLTKSFIVPAAPAPIIFESDIYTIVLAQDAKQIPDALAKVPEAKRPVMNKEIFDAYAKWYPGWTFALCCFNNKDAAQARPMLWWYEPRDKNTLFFPALDAHDGKVPKVGKKVPVDHLLMFSAEGLTPEEGGKNVSYRDFGDTAMPSSLAAVLPKVILGRQLGGEMPNGDFSVSISNLNEGMLNIDRVPPPGAHG